jgi:type I restriction enzyme M protein
MIKMAKKKCDDIITDYISGVDVKAGPEEVEAVQVFSKKLVEEYGYNKNQIQTRPQFRVKTAPSGKEKYPVDITVFNNNKKTYDNVYIIVECKQPNRKDGFKQLNIYLNLVPAVEFGVWFNGNEHLYLMKVIKDGYVSWSEIPDIPKKGERIEDVGLYKRKDLLKPKNLKSVFNDLRNHLAGNTTGITRDEAIAQQIINILFSKLYDEVNCAPNDKVEFRIGVNENKKDMRNRIDKLFNKVKEQYDDVFEKEDIIKLDDKSLSYVVGELQKYCILEADRDALGDAFEVFIGPALRGGEGQFFTPRNVVKMIVEILDPNPDEYIIDPACGSGGFLIVALEHVWKKIELEGQKKKWSADLISQKKRETATKFFRGIDKDSFLTKVTKAYMAIIGDGRGGIFCENTLLDPKEWKVKTRDKIELSHFDVLMTNPPFGAKIPIKGENILSQYELGKKWKFDKKTEKWIITSKYADKRPPQILFIERCLQLLDAGGRMGIVLPDSIVGNQTDGYIRDFILKHAKLIAVIDCPSETFQPSTPTKTSVVFIEKKTDDTSAQYQIFMAVAKKCGHGSRGKPIYKKDSEENIIPDDDFPDIVEAYKKYKEGN